MVKIYSIDEIIDTLDKGFCTEYIYMEGSTMSEMLVCKDEENNITASALLDGAYTTLIPLKNIKELVNSGFIYKRPFMFKE